MQQNITQQEAAKNGVPSKDQERLAPDKSREVRAIAPHVDVLEGADDVLVLADLPGVGAQDMTLHLESETLTLTATRNADVLGRAVRYERTFTVPADVDSERIEAKLERGILRLRLPKRASAKPRTIRVNAS